MTLAMLSYAAPAARSENTGISEDVAQIGDESVLVHVYRPRQCKQGRKPGPLMFVFAGYDRNADDYLRRARKIARAHCMTVFAPDLDRERFPRDRYQRAGIKINTDNADGAACMGLFIKRLAEWGREREARPDALIVLFGHSAGAQMLSRITAYCPLPDAVRIIIANPSSHVAASPIDPLPFGFSSILDVQERETRLRQYVSQPVTIYLGGDDTGSERLDDSLAARRQGANRLERGRNVFAAARTLAEARGWPFNWKLVIAPGVGHSSRDMLQADQMLDALAVDLKAK